MNRLYALGVAVLVIVALSFTSCTLLKQKEAASVKADIATKTLTEAVQESKASVRADYQVQQKKRAVLDSARPVVQLLKEKNAQATEPTVPVGAPDPWVGMFNDAVRTSNRAIESSVDMP